LGDNNQHYFTLVVEDTPELAEMIQLTLERVGVESYHAPNGQRALEFLAQQYPDLVILDIGLPGMSGWEILEAIKLRHPDATFPVIVLTAFSDPTNKLIGKFQKLVFRYLTKPFRPSILTETVQEALGLEIGA